MPQAQKSRYYLIIYLCLEVSAAGLAQTPYRGAEPGPLKVQNRHSNLQNGGFEPILDSDGPVTSRRVVRSSQSRYFFILLG